MRYKDEAPRLRRRLLFAAAGLRVHIPFRQENAGSQKEHGQKDGAAQQKAPNPSRHYVLGAVGIHAHYHQGIGPVQPCALTHCQQPGDASAQSDQYRQGKIPDDHGQQKL